MKEGNYMKERIEYLAQQEESSLRAYRALLKIQAAQAEAWFGNPKEAKEYKKHIFSESYSVEQALKRKCL